VGDHLLNLGGVGNGGARFEGSIVDGPRCRRVLVLIELLESLLDESFALTIINLIENLSYNVIKSIFICS